MAYAQPAKCLKLRSVGTIEYSGNRPCSSADRAVGHHPTGPEFESRQGHQPRESPARQAGLSLSLISSARTGRASRPPRHTLRPPADGSWCARGSPGVGAIVGWAMPEKLDKDEERISLHGHDPEEVLRALLAVDPDSEPAEDEPPTPSKSPHGRPHQRKGA